jgi:DnaK suppressor protein
MSQFSQSIILECRKRLLMMKEEILNRVRSSQLELAASDKMSGDEADQSSALLAENHLLADQERLRARLLEIEYALSRIDSGRYGVCEETQEPIEVERLLAIPYTRLSIEGAELREAMIRKFAR